jgi:uncharacterized Ntn-hydrolase superfamily protein
MNARILTGRQETMTARASSIASTLLLAIGLMTPLSGQEPARWGEPLTFATFSIAAIDPATGEVGVAVTTRVPCVGNAVPHVRMGVGALATQAQTRVEYGPEVLAKLAAGESPSAALGEAVSADAQRERRQVGVIGLDGQSAQHTGSGTSPWAGHRAGPNYVTQGNLLVGPEVLEAVSRNFEASQSSGRHLADRLIDALAAGQEAGGDARKGRLQSAAVIVADSRPGRSRRPDGVTADINVCENPAPIAELRRIYDTISETLGYRTLQQQSGSDVFQLRIILNALGYYRPGESEPRQGDGSNLFTQELVDAVNGFRKAEGLSGPEVGSPPGLVDDDVVARLWAALERAGKAEAIRARIRDLTAVRR